MTTNRNIKTNWETAVANPNIQVIDITERLRDNDYWFESLGMAFPPAVIAFFAGVGWGRSFVELGTIALSANLAAVTFGFSFALVIYLFVLVLHISTTTNSYYASKEEAEEEQASDAIIKTARRNEMKRLTGRMRSLLIRFATYYDEVGETMAIEAWWKSKYLNRKSIEDVRAYAVLIGAATEEMRGGRSFVELSEWGGAQLPKWRVNDFSDVARLAPTSPTPEDG